MHTFFAEAIDVAPQLYWNGVRLVSRRLCAASLLLLEWSPPCVASFEVAACTGRALRYHGGSKSWLHGC
jgi:hypothetical protein